MKLSVCTITYNHEKFIAQAIESMLMQKAKFDFELVIGEDFSTDRTREICISYKRKYPKKINLILNKKNLGPNLNFVNTLKQCKSKYIAICEGDDYWTDPYKLQKQVDFLEANPDYTICSHLVENFYQDENKKPYIFPYENLYKDTYTFEDFLYRNLINTCSVVYRWQFHNKPLPNWFSNHFTADYSLHLLHAYQGNIKVFPELLAKRRIHSQGIMSGSRRKYRVYKLTDRIEFLNNINRYTKFNFDKIITNVIKKYQKSLIHALLYEGRKYESKLLFNEIKVIMKMKDKFKYLLHFYFPVLFLALKKIKKSRPLPYLSCIQSIYKSISKVKDNGRY